MGMEIIVAWPLTSMELIQRIFTSFSMVSVFYSKKINVFQGPGIRENWPAMGKHNERGRANSPGPFWFADMTLNGPKF